MIRRFCALLSISIAMLAIAATSSNAVPPPQLYGLSSTTTGGTLYTIDTSTGVATEVVTLTGDVSTSGVGLAYMNGTFYATDVRTSTEYATFGTINQSTGAYTPLSNQIDNDAWRTLAPVTNSVFYTVDVSNADTLTKITLSGPGLTTVTTTPIGPGLGTDIDGLAYDTTTGVLYGTSDTYLYTIDTTTGIATEVGSLDNVSNSVNVDNSRNDLAWDWDTSTMYFNVGEGNPSFSNDSLYTVNLSNGGVTHIGGNGVTNYGIDGITFVPEELPPPPSAPEPAATTVLFIGMLGILGLALRARKARSS